jgi:hypothetical protein
MFHRGIGSQETLQEKASLALAVGLGGGNPPDKQIAPTFPFEHEWLSVFWPVLTPARPEPVRSRLEARPVYRTIELW